LVVAVRDVLVDTSVRVIVAPTIAPWDGSVTVPVIVPVETDCPRTIVGAQIQNRSTKKRIPTTLIIFGIFDITLPLHSHLDIPEGNLEQI
jgi:hypothetical protein